MAAYCWPPHPTGRVSRPPTHSSARHILCRRQHHAGQRRVLPRLTAVHGGCEASVQLSDNPQFAVSVSDSTSSSCKGPRAALDTALERLRDDSVLRDLPTNSALGIDTCLLLAEETTRDLLGPTSTASGLHGCEWDGNRSVRVRVAPGFPGHPLRRMPNRWSSTASQRVP